MKRRTATFYTEPRNCGAMVSNMAGAGILNSILRLLESTDELLKPANSAWRHIIWLRVSFYNTALKFVQFLHYWTQLYEISKYRSTHLGNLFVALAMLNWAIRWCCTRWITNVFVVINFRSYKRYYLCWCGERLSSRFCCSSCTIDRHLSTGLSNSLKKEEMCVTNVRKDVNVAHLIVNKKSKWKCATKDYHGEANRPICSVLLCERVKSSDTKRAFVQVLYYWF
jgi:hypothetical protein